MPSSCINPEHFARLDLELIQDYHSVKVISVFKLRLFYALSCPNLVPECSNWEWWFPQAYECVNQLIIDAGDKP